MQEVTRPEGAVGWPRGSQMQEEAATQLRLQALPGQLLELQLANMLLFVPESSAYRVSGPAEASGALLTHEPITAKQQTARNGLQHWGSVRT